MRVTSMSNGKKIISFGPMHNGNYKYTTTVYEAKGQRLTVDTTFKNGVRSTQTKTLSDKNGRLKEIVIEFVQGIRDKVYRVR